MCTPISLKHRQGRDLMIQTNARRGAGQQTNPSSTDDPNFWGDNV